MPITKRTPNTNGLKALAHPSFRTSVFSSKYHAFNAVSILLPFSIRKVAIVPQLASWTLLNKKHADVVYRPRPLGLRPDFSLPLFPLHDVLLRLEPLLGFSASSKACILGVTSVPPVSPVWSLFCLCVPANDLIFTKPKVCETRRGRQC
jgi:hypothetical protein